MKNVLIAGATGTQGGAVVDELHSGEYGDYELYGLTRDADGEAARALAERDVTVVEGDMTDADRMHELCTDMDVVFAVTTFMESGTTVETEQGRTLADAAADAGVEHFVYSSVGSADEATGLPHFDSKYAVEEHVATLDLPTTVVRPVFFMQNFAYMHGEELADGTLTMPLDSGTPLQVVDAADIGVAVATAIADPERYADAVLELAGDELTHDEFASAFATRLGHDVEAVHVPIADYREYAGDEMADMFAWFNAVGYSVDIDALHDDHGVPTRDFAAFLADADAFVAQPAA